MVETTEQQKRWSQLAGSCDIYTAAVVVASVLAVGAGLALIFAQTMSTDGSYRSDGLVYAVRPAGAVLVGLGVLFGPFLVLMIRVVQTYAMDRAES